MKYKILTLIILLACVSLEVKSKDYMLFYLEGQSNMDGHELVKNIPKEALRSLRGVCIFHRNRAVYMTAPHGIGLWSQLQEGHGRGFSSDGITNTYSEKFDVEITFSYEMKKKYPDKNIAIIKYSKGGTAFEVNVAGQFGCWSNDFNIRNGVNQYDHFLATVKNAKSVSDIDEDGEQDTLMPIGIVWMQGDSDAEHTQATALKYATNLTKLLSQERAAFWDDNLPIVIGRIADSGQDDDGQVWDYGEIVRAQQLQFVHDDRNATLVTSTDNYGYSDKWYYDTDGYLDLGKQFALAVIKLLEED